MFASEVCLTGPEFCGSGGLMYNYYGGCSGKRRGRPDGEDEDMPTQNEGRPNLTLGDRVKIRKSAGLKGRIVELRGPLGPGGAQIYRVQLRRKPRAYIEVREDQLEIILPVADSSEEKGPG